MWMVRKSFFCPTKLPPEPSHSLLLVTPNPPGSDASNGNQHSQKASLRVMSLTAAPGLCSCSSQKRPPPLSLISVTFYSASGLTYTPHPVT